MIRAVFFDLDGVLTLDRAGSVTSSRYVAEKLGVDYKALLAKKSRFSKAVNNGDVDNIDVWTSICAEYGAKFDPAWLKGAFESTPIDPKMIDLAGKLKTKYKTGIITDNEIDRVNTLAAMHNWDKVFDSITISAQVGCTKREPLIFETAVKSLGLKPEECVFIDNVSRNIAVAEKFGMTGIFFNDAKRDYSRIEQLAKNITMNHNLR